MKVVRRRTYAILAIVLVLVVAAAVGFVLLRRSFGRYYSTTVQLTAVAFPDLRHAWAVGDTYTDGGLQDNGGAIHATADGGRSWRQQKSGRNWYPSAVAFANASCGWMVGDVQLDINGKPLGGDVNAIFATTDGGATWKTEHAGTTYPLDAIACASATHAWVVGGYFKHGIILSTADGGTSWRRQYETTTAGSLDAVAFADTRHGWAVGWGSIVATTNGGTTWKQQGSFSQYRLFNVACAGDAHAWVNGLDASDHEVILATTDDGTTWKVQYRSASMTLSGLNCGMAFADTTHGWVVGNGGTILATTDGGRSWQPHRSGTKLILLGVAFADARHGLVVGNRFEGDDPMAAKFDGSIILRTTDGGATWTH